jgi:hypothetical protein
MAPAQPQATVNINTRGSRDVRFAIALRTQRVEDHPSNSFVDSVLGQLQEAFEAQCRVDDTGLATTEEVELQQRKLECVKAGLYALRRIHTAWSKYPAVGDRLEGAQIQVVDFRYTAHSAVVDKPDGQLADQYCRIMASSVDPMVIENESAPHAQPRVNNCFLALKKQYMALFHIMDPVDLKSHMFDEDIPSDDEAVPRSYELQASWATLHPPSTGAYLMSDRGLAEAAEFEEDNDNQHIYVTGAVLRTKAEKRADRAVQVAKAKEEEQAAAASARVRASAAKATAAGKGKGKGRKSDTPPVEDEEDEEEEEDVETPAKKPAAKKAAPRKIKGGKKATSPVEDEEVVGEDTTATKSPLKKSTASSRKRPAPAADVDEAEEDDTASKPPPKKRAKSTPAAKSTTAAKSTPAAKSTASGNTPAAHASSSNTSGEAGSVAPKIAKRGGAAPKWLKDEDDLVKQMIVDHPELPMPAIYRAYSQEVANTPYQRIGQASVEYRADFVEFPKGIIASDKERRKFDISWRTYESVRQHCESFKAMVSRANTSAPFTWDECQANQAAGQPKRAPPPRPAFFFNDAHTPVPPVNPATTPALASGPTAPAAAAPSPTPAATQKTRKSSDWTAINRLFVPYVPKEAANETAPPVEESVEGDAEASDLEDFVANQSE